MNKNAVIILSGGLDSATCLAIAKNTGFACHAITFDYGQRNRIEIESAKKVCAQLQVASHILFKLPINQFKGSSLTDNSITVPEFNKDDDDIPSTYVPARNTIFLSIALGYAETLSASSIFIGVNAIDYSGYPDCRPEYISAFEKVASLATKSGVFGEKFKIQTPLIDMQKKDIIKKGISLGVDYSLTTTCYNPSTEGFACGNCDSCHHRKEGFSAAGVNDPTIYKKTI